MANGRMNDNRPRDRRPMQEEKQFDERVVYVNRVARVVRGGRRFRFQSLVIIGDHKGQVGIGVSKGADVSASVNKATDSAKKSLVKLPIRRGTLEHEVRAKVGGSNILIFPAAPGTGLIAGGVVRTILEVAGYENALSKSIGSSNRVNTAYATVEALQKMVPRSQWITPSGTASTTKKPKAEVKVK